MDENQSVIDYKDLLKIFKKRFYIIIAIIIVILGFSIFYKTQMTKPMYEAKVSIIIGNVLDGDKSQFQIGDVNSNQVYMQTYIMILKTNIVAQRTINSLDLDISVDEFKRHITAAPQPGTQFLEIRIKWGDPEEAALILDTISQVFIEEAMRIYPTYTIKILEKTNPHLKLVLSNKYYYLLTLIGAFFIAILVVLIMEVLDNTIKTEEDIEKYLDIPVIGTIPKYKSSDISIVELIKANRHPSLDSYRTLRTNLYYVSRKFNTQAIVVTSARPREGKSTVASMLAIVLAQWGKCTLIIDCDFRKPIIHEVFNVSRTGLSNILIGESEWTDVVYESTIENLFVLPAGFKPLNPVELLSTDKMKQLLSELRRVFDYIIIDTPPVGLVTEAQVLSQFSDGYLIVVSAGESDKDSTIKAQRLIQYAEGKILGALLNKVPDSKIFRGYNQYYK